MWFKAYHAFGHGKSMDTSNYVSSFEAQTCKACGLCVKRCPMEVITLEASDKATNKKGKIAVLQEEACIGCGVCAYKCPTDSITLVERKQRDEPPADIKDYVGRFIKDFTDPLPRRKV